MYNTYVILNISPKAADAQAEMFPSFGEHLGA